MTFKMINRQQFMVFRMFPVKTEVQEIRVDENQNVTYLICGIWQTASMLYQRDIQNYYDILLRRQVDNILDFHTHFCQERPKETEYQISYKDDGKHIKHVKVAAPYLSSEPYYSCDSYDPTNSKIQTRP